MPFPANRARAGCLPGSSGASIAGMKRRKKRGARGSAGAAEVCREAGTLAAATYLRATGSRADAPPVIGRHVGITTALMQRMGPGLVKAAREARARRTALDWDGGLRV